MSEEQRRDAEDVVFGVVFAAIFVISFVGGVGAWWWTGDFANAWPLAISVTVILIFGFGG